MKQFEIGFSYKIEEYGVVTLDAVDTDEADTYGREHVYETYPGVADITIDYIKEI